jgi:hypothetical protein
MSSTICPRCGRKKTRTAYLCRSCDAALPDWSHVPELWLQQFVGWFLARGHIGARITPYGRLSIKLVIRVSEVEREILDDVQRLLGGNVRVEGRGTQKPVYGWFVAGQGKARAILAALGERMLLPGRRAAQVRLANEFFALLDRAGEEGLDREQLIAFQRSLSELKK